MQLFFNQIATLFSEEQDSTLDQAVLRVPVTFLPKLSMMVIY